MLIINIFSFRPLLAHHTLPTPCSKEMLSGLVRLICFMTLRKEYFTELLNFWFNSLIVVGHWPLYKLRCNLGWKRRAWFQVHMLQACKSETTLCCVLCYVFLLCAEFCDLCCVFYSVLCSVFCDLCCVLCYILCCVMYNSVLCVRGCAALRRLGGR